MTIERVATNAQSQFLLSQINRTNVALNDAQQQVSSGKVANDYAGYKDKVAVLEAARSTAARVDSYQSATRQAITQADLQDTQINSLADLAAQLRQSLTDAVGQSDASTLMTQARSIFDSASQLLNSRDANGNYLYGGEQNDSPPFKATSFDDLSTLGSVAQAFSNGQIKQSVRVGDGESVEVGVLASDLGTDLMTSLKSIADYVNANGAFTGTVTPDQATFLTGQIQSAKTAAENLNNAGAANGFVFNRLKDASDKQDSLATLYKGFVSDIEDVDMPTAITKLNQTQVALQASLQVTAQLQQISLLNYLK